MEENTSKEEEKIVNKADENQEEINEVNVEELQKELEDAQSSAKENYEKSLRIQAEMENLRKRSTKDIENAHKFALDGFAKSLLEVADSIAMGIKAANEENSTVESLKEGLEMTNKVFFDVLTKNNIQQINPTDGKFNPEQHEAITMLPNTGKESGEIIDVTQVGFSLNDRVIRPAMVVVAQ